MNRSKEEKKAENQKKVEAFRRDQWKYDLLESAVGKASIPLLTPTSRGAALEPISSGVVTKLRDRVFIFTALHSLKWLTEKPVFLPIRDGSIIQIEGTAHGKTKDDAGVFHVENKNLDPILDIAIPGGAVFAQSEILSDNLLLYGFPAREYSRDAKVQKVDCPPRMFQMKGLKGKAYRRLKRDPKDYILINWPNKVLGSQGFVGSPDLKGMSGCGVWYNPFVNRRPLSLHAADPMPRLVGIFIEQWRDRAMLIATNVQHHVEIVWMAYPELLERYREDIMRTIGQRRQLEEVVLDQEFWRR
jgi:hypothetical protein